MVLINMISAHFKAAHRHQRSAQAMKLLEAAWVKRD
jgi:hypothetical protein